MNLELKSCPKCKQGVDMCVIRHLDSDADMCLVVGCLEDGHPELYGTLSDFELTLVDIGVEAPDLAERWNALPREEKPKQRFVEVRAFVCSTFTRRRGFTDPRTYHWYALSSAPSIPGFAGWGWRGRGLDGKDLIRFDAPVLWDV